MVNIESSKINGPAGQANITSSCNNQRCELHRSRYSYSQNISKNAIFVFIIIINEEVILMFNFIQGNAMFTILVSLRYCTVLN